MFLKSKSFDYQRQQPSCWYELLNYNETFVIAAMPGKYHAYEKKCPVDNHLFF